MPPLAAQPTETAVDSTTAAAAADAAAAHTKTPSGAAHGAGVYEATVRVGEGALGKPEAEATQRKPSSRAVARVGRRWVGWRRA